LNKNDRWGTPPEYVKLARLILGDIDLDPASEECFQLNIKANKFYTAEDDGLTKPWKGRVWCNPPYSAVLIKKFTNKFVEEYLKGNMIEGLILTNSGTDTQWNLPLGRECIQAYTIGRISFIQPDGTYKATGSRGQCLSYVGKHPDKFINIVIESGKFWVPNLKLIDYYK
jgi:phage N-6-adenine-methyltransferase